MSTPGVEGRRRPRRVLRVLGAVALAVVLVVAMGAVYLYRDLNSGFHVSNDQDKLTNRPSDGPSGPIDILVMGSDSRAGDNDIDGDSSTGERSDTTILLHISADRSRAYGISIPRDSIVDRPACPASERFDAQPAAEHRLWNEAFAVGGAVCTMQQFEQLTGIRLEHHIVVDFYGFKTMVDAIGGVRMCIPEDMVDNDYTHTTIKAGKDRLLDGDESRTYVRMRHITNPQGDPIGDGSDVSRTRRQQAFIGAIANQAMTAGVLANPVKLRNFLKAVIDSVTVDKGLGNLRKMAGLGLQLRGIGVGNIQFLTIPNYYPPEDPDHVKWREPQADEVWNALQKDEPIPASLLTGVITAGDPATGGSTGTPRPSPSTSPSASGDPLPKTQYDDPARNGLCS
ncbi:LCP family protein [Nocardioides sp. Kera G14]|uniref:LCP family protein n=1 Tax=Nocardioides sp. Kera G14 TaxID=2884264 RepID=UPI001D121E7C|nr:LCP family protein [Nocardioides sp. Kera G14]UDY23543.1 LCP family protein [Nocardioides sp. Kera G14]